MTLPLEDHIVIPVARQLVWDPTTCRPHYGSPYTINGWEIEERIYPLVKAFLDTELVVTASSCEGHFEDTARPHYNLRQDRANVVFEPRADLGVSAAMVEQFIADVVGRSGCVQGAWFSKNLNFYHKGALQHSYWVKLSPDSDYTDIADRRRTLDDNIAHLTEIIREGSL